MSDIGIPASASATLAAVIENYISKSYSIFVRFNTTINGFYYNDTSNLLIKQINGITGITQIKTNFKDKLYVLCGNKEEEVKQQLKSI